MHLNGHDSFCDSLIAEAITCLSKIGVLPVFTNPGHPLMCTVVAMEQNHSTSWTALTTTGREERHGWDCTAAIPVTAARVTSPHSSVIPYEFSPEGLSGVLEDGSEDRLCGHKKGFVFCRKIVCIIKVLVK